jgi:hypothetical protein
VPREYAKNLFAKWIDEDWLNQPLFDKLFWEGLNGNRSVNLIGVAPLNMTRWARMMRDGDRLATESELKAALVRMGRRRYVYVDENTGEYLIRSRMRRDELDRQPKSFLSALRMLAVLDSPRFAAALQGELARMSLPVISTARNEAAANRLQDDLKRAWDRAQAHLDTLAEGIPDPIPDPFPNVIADPIPRPAETHNDQPPQPIPSPMGSNSGSGSVSGSGSPTRDGYVGEGNDPEALETTPTPPAPNEPPPSRCPKHIHDEHPPDCGACGGYRRARERWDTNQRAAAAEARTAELRAQADAKARAIADCPRCDEDGYRNGTVCDHDPNREATTARGMAEIRAVLRGKKAEPDNLDDIDDDGNPADA